MEGVRGAGIRLEDVPDYRLRLLNIWRPGGTLEKALLWVNDARREDLWRHWSAEEMELERRTLQHGALFWLTPNFRTLMEACVPTLPSNLGVGTDIPPPQGFGAGLVVLSEPLMSPNYDEPDDRDEDIPIEAFTYQPILRQNAPTLGIGSEPTALLRLVFYAKKGYSTGVGPVGVAEWEAGHTIAAVRQLDVAWDNPRILADLQLDRRRFAAFAMLVNQTITEVTEHRALRPVDRRCQRAGVPSTVQVVRLRRVSGARSEPEGETLVEWSHQWLVSGHWRNQACGPSLSERRWTFIAPYVKGPEDKPLILKDKVYAAVR